MQGSCEEFCNRRAFDDLSRVHDENVLAEVSDDIEIMSDQKNTCLELALQGF